MSRSAPHKALRIVGIVLVILLPVVLALWFAQIRAKAETADQLRLFLGWRYKKRSWLFEKLTKRAIRPVCIREKCVRRIISNICSALYAVCSISTT